MIVLGSNYRASGPPVYLPTTESAADANTFVCEMTGGASANETGVGGGLSGGDLVFTQVGGIGAASGGYRLIDSVNKYFTCTAAWAAAFLNAAEFSIVYQVNGLTVDTNPRIFNDLEGAVNALMMAFTNNGRVTSYSSSSQFPCPGGTSFAGSTPYYFAFWRNCGALHSGYCLQSSGFPTGWDSFPSSQRGMCAGVPQYADTWSVLRVFGYPALAANLSIGTIVASKIGIAAGPV